MGIEKESANSDVIDKMTKQELFIYLNDKYRIKFYMGTHKELIYIAKFLDADHERSGTMHRQCCSTIH